MNAHTHCRCHFCGVTIPAGSPVQWYRKSGFRAAKSRFISERNVACCLGAFPGECEATALAANSQRRNEGVAALAATLAELLTRGDTEGALTALTNVRGVA